MNERVWRIENRISILFECMHPLYTQEQFDISKSSDKLPCQCISCGITFYKQKKAILKVIRRVNGHNGDFCSRSCLGSTRKLQTSIACKCCGNFFQKKQKEIKRHSNHFCSRSCAATYNNTHKTHGTRRSKLEVWLEQQLSSLYPSLEFHFNRKDAINAELDIYIPSFKLAFELNGLFHYEPIFGPEKLAKIQNNDQRKYQACIEHGIELCLIDVSSFSYFKPERAQKYLNGIRKIIHKRERVAGFQPAT